MRVAPTQPLALGCGLQDGGQSTCLFTEFQALPHGGPLAILPLLLYSPWNTFPSSLHSVPSAPASRIVRGALQVPGGMPQWPGPGLQEHAVCPGRGQEAHEPGSDTERLTCAVSWARLSHPHSSRVTVSPEQLCSPLDDVFSRRVAAHLH